jgi:hypothetical protein
MVILFVEPGSSRATLIHPQIARISHSEREMECLKGSSRQPQSDVEGWTGIQLGGIDRTRVPTSSDDIISQYEFNAKFIIYPIQT